MKNIIYMFIVIVLFQGCTAAKYAADKAMWEAKSAAIIAQTNAANKPLVVIKTANNEIFTVNNPNIPKPMMVVGEPNAFVQIVDITLNSWLAKLFGGGILADKLLGNMRGETITAGDNSTIGITKDSGNVLKSTESGGIMTEESHLASDNVDNSDRSDQSDNSDHSDLSDHSDNSDNSTDSTSTPTIVRPEVVRPEVVIPE